MLLDLQRIAGKFSCRERQVGGEGGEPIAFLKGEVWWPVQHGWLADYGMPSRAGWCDGWGNGVTTLQGCLE